MFRGKKGLTGNEIFGLLLGVAGFWILVKILLIGGGLSIATFFASPVLIVTVVVFLIIFFLGKKK